MVGIILNSDHILEVNHISKSFIGLQVLIDVSLKVPREGILGLIGPNGAGKTVLLNCINGVYPLDRGKIEFDGIDITRIPRHKIATLGISRTFQNIELFNQLNVLENTIVGGHFRYHNSVFSGGLFWGSGRAEEIKARKDAEEILDFLELYNYRKQLVGNLPYGVQKIVGLARAMNMHPKILLLDEIASGLNREEREDLARFLLRIKFEKQIPMIWIEHDMELVTQISDRLICLNNGILIAEGPPAQVVQNSAVIEAYLGIPKN